jgi:hypothetical protein
VRIPPRKRKPNEPVKFASVENFTNLSKVIRGFPNAGACRKSVSFRNLLRQARFFIRLFPGAKNAPISNFPISGASLL